MSLTRFEVLEVNATVIAGVLILLTLTNVGENFQEEELGFFKIYFDMFVTASIVPFAISAIIEIKAERKLKAIDLHDRLRNELELANKENNAERQKDLNRLLKNIKREMKQIPFEYQILKSDEPTRQGLKLMQLGFAYLFGTIVMVFIIRLIEWLPKFMQSTEF